MSAAKGYKIRNQYGLYYLTFTIVGWADIFTRQVCKDIIIDSFKYCITNKGFRLYAFVIMSNHVHLIASADEESKGLSAIVRDLKKHTSKELINWVTTSKTESRRDWLKMIFEYYAKYNKRNKKYQVWQQDNRPIDLLYPRFIMQKLNYIHQNPVKAGLVAHAAEYCYSSAKNYAGQVGKLEVELIDFGMMEGYVPV
ncbi:MAG: transposase [Saprospiraceae bacterium]